MKPKCSNQGSQKELESLVPKTNLRLQLRLQQTPLVEVVDPKQKKLLLQTEYNFTFLSVFLYTKYVCDNTIWILNIFFINKLIIVCELTHFACFLQ